MGSRSLGELLLRPSAFARTAPCTRFTPSWTAQRYLSNSSSDQAAQPARQATPGVAASPRQRATSEATSQAIDDLFSGPPSAQPPRPTSDAAPKNRINHVFGAEFSKPSRGRLARTPGLNFDDMILPESLANPSLANKPAVSTLAAQQAATFENYPRLNPTYGRTVDLDVSRGRDIVRGIGMLGSLMARNKVKNDFNKQKFHERGGLKRKRLNSERWRARFKQGFRDLTTRVTELTRKGW
jgi:small subunit ribosomal protein MRP21